MSSAPLTPPSARTACAIALCPDESLQRFARNACSRARLPCLCVRPTLTPATLIATFAPLAILVEDSDGQDAVEIVARIRRTGFKGQVTVLSAERRSARLVEALEAGADDYASSDESIEQVGAILQARLRTAGHHGAEPARLRTDTILRFPHLSIDLSGRRVERDGTAIDLGDGEFDLLALLARNQHRALSVAELRQELGLSASISEATVRWYVAQLRAHLEPDPTHPAIITRVSRLGYRFTPPANPTTDVGVAL